MNEIGDDDSNEEDWSTVWDTGGLNEKNTVSQYNVYKQNQSKGETESDDNKQNGSAPEACLLSRMQLNDNKAGMEGVDKEKINQIIYEASKGSRYYENELKREEQVNRRIAEQKAKLDKLTEQSIIQGEIMADGLLQELESTRTLDRAIVHIDMDAFYAAVEMRDQPSLKDKPMAVGGSSMLSTSNYIARKYGVRAAMPGFIGKKLCPQLVIVPTNFDKYTAVSKQVRGIMADYDPNFCPMSLDEAYLDFTEHLKVRLNMSEEERSFAAVREQEDCVCRYSMQKGDAEATVQQTDEEICGNCGLCISKEKKVIFGCDLDEAVNEMRHRIHLRTRLTASAGIAPNTMLAKVCSDKNKPNGQYRIHGDREEVFNFIQDLPIRKVSGVGKVSEKMLSSIGVVTCSDLYKHRGLVYLLYSNISYNYFMRISLGLGSTEVCRDGERKSLSTETTFREINKPEELFAKCAELCQDVVQDLKKEQLLGKTVGIKIKTVKFDLKTRAQTVSNYTQSYEQIYKAAKDLLKIEINACHPQPLRLRLMGVRMSNLINESEMSKQRQNTITSFLKKKINNSPLKDTEEDSKNKIEPEISPTKRDQNSKKVKNVAESSPQKTSERSVFKSMIHTMYQRSTVKKLEGAGIHTIDIKTGISNTAKTDANVDDKCSISEHKNNDDEAVKSIQKSISVLSKSVTGMCTDKCNMCNKTNISCNCFTVSRSSDKSIVLTEGTISVASGVVASASGTPVSIIAMLAPKSVKSVSSNATDACTSVATPTSSKKKSLESVQCPVCGRTIKSSNVKVITEHIDYCLAKNETPNEVKDLENEIVTHHDKIKLEESNAILQLKNSRSDNLKTQNFGEGNRSDNFKSEVDGNLKMQVGNCSEDKKIPCVPHEDVKFSYDKLVVEKSEALNFELRSINKKKVDANVTSHKDETGCDFESPVWQEKKIFNINAKVGNNSVNCKVNGEFEVLEEKTSPITCADNKELDRNLSVETTLLSSEASTSGVGFDSFPYICPVCNVSQYEMNLSEFNIHVDSCLSKKAIKEILHESDSYNICSGAMLNNNNKRTTNTKGKFPKNKRQKIEKGLQTLEGFMTTEK